MTMLAGIYGRQWNNTSPEMAFRPNLLAADRACIRGETRKGIELYKKESNINQTAKRRLKLAAKQHKIFLKNNHSNHEIYPINIGFIDWYHGYERDIQPYILDLFGQAGIQWKISSAEKSDILIAGCYGTDLISQIELSQDKLVIFVSGENLSPSYNIHDFSICTRQSDYCGKNIRLPQWYGDIKIKGKEIWVNESINPLPKQPSKRDIMVSAIYNNATPERESQLAILRELFGHENIHVFGSHRGKQVDKMEILSRSVINMCFENSLGEGYITEKLLHSKIMGCKSLYWGDESYLLDFSVRDVHNVKANSMMETIEWCKKAIEYDQGYYYQSSRIDVENFAAIPNLDSVIRCIKNWSKLVLNLRQPY